MRWKQNDKRRWHHMAMITAAAAAIACLMKPLQADALERLRLQRLKATHEAVQALRVEWRKLPRSGPYEEVRANLHVHSGFSHDSRGTIDEIVAAAKAAGSRVIMFTEHPSEQIDYFKDGHRGTRDGVLLIPGAETRGLLVFPTQSLRGLEGGSVQEFSDLVRRGGGLTFLSHLENRMDWEIRGLTGTEIYNTHANFKAESNLAGALRNPAWLIGSFDLFRRYAQECFSSIQEYPAEYLKRWDQLCARAPHTGVAANDSHQNIGVAIRLVEADKLRLEDALGERIFEVDASLVSGKDAARKGKKPGDILFQVQLDAYEYSLRHVGTHLLVREVSEKGVWDALESGRAFVAFDWMGDATGFDFAALSDSRKFEMGSRPHWKNGMRLKGAAPLPGRWKLFRDGKVVAESPGRAFDYVVKEPGNYRVEVWLRIADDDLIWILSNPVYVR
jgi:hypothetical protein